MLMNSALDFAPLWEMAKGVMLTGVTAGVGWMIRKLNAIDRRQVTHEHILIGVDGKNGLRSKVDLLVTRVDAIEDRNIAIDAVAEAERHQHPGPDRRVGVRRIRDVTHEALDERARRHTGEHDPNQEE